MVTRTLRRIRRFGLRTYLGRKAYSASPGLYHTLVGRDRDGFVRTAYGVEMARNWDDATFRMCVFGGHGAVLADLLAGLDRPFVFLDVGANQGLFTLLAVRNPACRAAVAFEPVAETFALLDRNARRAPGNERIRTVQAAISSDSGTARIGVAADHSGAATLAARGADGGEGEEIRLMTAAEVDPLIPPDLPVFAKVDVEGYEPVVIPELLRLSAAPRITHLFFEVDTAWVDADALTDALRAAGFTDFTRHGRAQHFDVLATRDQAAPEYMPS